MLLGEGIFLLACGAMTLVGHPETICQTLGPSRKVDKHFHQLEEREFRHNIGLSIFNSQRIILVKLFLHFGLKVFGQQPALYMYESYRGFLIAISQLTL